MKVVGPQTVNRLKLTAILAVQEDLPPFEQISISTDSKCSIQKVTSWIADPASLDGDKHADILHGIAYELAKRATPVYIRKVPAHCGVHRNEVVDQAAKKQREHQLTISWRPAA